MLEITFLEENQIFGENKLEIFKKRGTKAAITDFAILLGGYVSDVHLDGKNSLKDRTGDYSTKTYDGVIFTRAVDFNGDGNCSSLNVRFVGCRPALIFSSIDEITTNVVSGRAGDGLLTIEMGYLPKWSVSKKMQKELEFAFENGRLSQKGNGWTTDSRRYDEYRKGFSPMKQIPYEYNGKMYSRVKANLYRENTMLSNGKRYKTGDYVWVEVEPIRWLASEKDKVMIPEEEILAGIQFGIPGYYKVNFKKTNIYKYLNTYLIKEMFSAVDFDSLKKVVIDRNLSEEGMLIKKNLSEEETLIEKIKSLISNLQIEEQAKYKDKLDEIINIYENNIDNVFPSLDNEFVLSLERNSVLGVRAKFICNLNKLYLSIAFKVTDFSVKVNNSIKYISSLERGNEVFSSVVDVTLVLEKLDERTRNIYKEKLLNILSDYQDISSSFNDEEVKLTLENESFELRLQLEISLLVDELNKYIEENFNVISELLDLENIDNEESSSLIREKYLYIKESLNDEVLDLFNKLLEEYKVKLYSNDDKTLIIKEFYESLEKLIDILKIKIIERNIESVINDRDEIVTVSNEKLSLSLTYYQCIFDFIKEMKEYVSLKCDENIALKYSRQFSLALSKKIEECMEILDSDFDLYEKAKKISGICLLYKQYIDNVISYDESVKNLVRF